jgi:hypothetical protein
VHPYRKVEIRFRKKKEKKKKLRFVLIQEKNHAKITKLECICTNSYKLVKIKMVRLKTKSN